MFKFLDRIKESLAGTMEKRKQEQEYIESLQVQARAEQKRIFEEEYKKKALEMAKARAIADAERLSGYRKFQALNKAINLEQNAQGPGGFSKLAEYTQKNLARTQQRLERTKIMREAARQEKERQQQSRVQQRQNRMVGNGFR